MVDGTLPGERAQPLRPQDPRRLGAYELVGRLGEGGMGTVYLAKTAGDVLVALKVVRADLAHDDEFRRRFRSEVDRARQVPPFCTAEVLDADPDHEHPYLVVEFVSGPTLADVVEQRGPLTTANLHGVAIGVATALTAIHGAGVIHRDLKPRNVLLAPGSPKVIDFGIARAMEGTSANTRSDQMVGTVAYMAPERFSAEPGTPVTPAADVFAWGAVVSYAGTGRTPFSADSPPATAARILTQPPNLDGLTGPLRDLVAHALEKDPANRPSARELLDLLISGPRPAAATAAAFADQPALRAAATEAQAVTGYVGGPQDTTSNVPALAIPPGMVGYDENSIVTVPISAVPGLEADSSAGPRRRWALTAGVALLITSVIAGVAMVAWPGRTPAGEAATPPTPSSSVSSAAVRPGQSLRLEDPLERPRLWQASASKDGKSGCCFDGGALLAEGRKTTNPWRCSGPNDNQPGDMHAEVSLRLLNSKSCATVWLRWDGSGGYQVRFCEQRVYISTHKTTDGVQILKTIPLDDRPITLDAETRVGLTVRDDVLEVSRNGAALGSEKLADPEISTGRVHVGIFTEEGASREESYAVSFRDIKVWG